MSTLPPPLRRHQKHRPGHFVAAGC
ncbi:Protein of unknown function [Propionibacterium freudenreichii]|nr:Protein of unknown function [Propionibacterium freudenreichii]